MYHNFLSVGGIMIHAIPLVGSWKGHCNYHYEDNFLELLSELNGYDVYFSEIRHLKKRRTVEYNESLCAVLLKKENISFMRKKDFIIMNTIKRT